MMGEKGTSTIILSVSRNASRGVHNADVGKMLVLGRFDRPLLHELEESEERNDDLYFFFEGAGELAKGKIHRPLHAPCELLHHLLYRNHGLDARLGKLFLLFEGGESARECCGEIRRGKFIAWREDGVGSLLAARDQD